MITKAFMADEDATDGGEIIRVIVCLHRLLRQGYRSSLGKDEDGWFWSKGNPAPYGFEVDEALIGRLFNFSPDALVELIKSETQPLATLAAKTGARPGRLTLDFHESGRGIVSLFGEDRILMGPFEHGGRTADNVCHVLAAGAPADPHRAPRGMPI